MTTTASRSVWQRQVRWDLLHRVWSSLALCGRLAKLFQGFWQVMNTFWTWNTYINSKEIIHFRDKSGTINQSELQEALTTFGYNLSPQVQTKSHHPPPSYHSRKFQKGLMWMLDANLSMKVPKMCSKKPTLRCLFWKLLSGVPAPVAQVRPNWSPSGLLWRLHPVLPCHAGLRFGWKEQRNYTKESSIDPFHMHEARLFL